MTEMQARPHSENPEEFKKHLGKYYVVFVALLCLTAITVGVSYLHLNRPLAIAVALVIASVKAGLVAAKIIVPAHDDRIIVTWGTVTPIQAFNVLSP